MAEGENGQAPADTGPKPRTLSITLTQSEKDPNKLDISVSMPQQLTEAYTMLKMLQDAVFQQALHPPERKVKTLDEMGVRPIRRLQ